MNMHTAEASTNLRSYHYDSVVKTTKLFRNYIVSISECMQFRYLNPINCKTDYSKVCIEWQFCVSECSAMIHLRVVLYLYCCTKKKAC